MREWVGNYLKLLTIDAYPLGFRITHALQPGAYFVDFDGGLAEGRSINIHDDSII
jgi:hypothetical protein